MMSNFGIAVIPVRNPKNKLCRTCLKQHFDMKSIFNSEVNSVPIYQMLTAAIPIEIKADDGLPGHLCSQCIQSLINAYKFQKMCINNDFKLRNYITVFHSNPETSEDTTINFDSMSSSVDPKTDKTEVYELADDEDMCEVVKIESDDDDDDIQGGGEPIQQLLKDASTVDESPEQSSGTLIWSSSNDAIQLDERDFFSQEQNEWNDLFCCSICYARFETKVLYERHMQMHGTKTQQLPKPVERKLENPVLKTVYLCKICKTAFGTEDMLNLHKKVHERPSKNSSDKSSHVCNICKNSFKTWEELTQHISEHQIKILYGTEKGSNTTVNVNVNIQTEKTYECKTCNKTFNGGEELSLHEKEHIATKNIPAVIPNPIPEKESNQINTQITNAYFVAYNPRKKTDAEIDSTQCKYCGNIFSNSSNLRRHVRRQHRKIKPPKDPLQIDDEFIPVAENLKKLAYKCEVCNQEFEDKIFFLTHKKLHMIEEILNEKKENDPLTPQVETIKLSKVTDDFKLVYSVPKFETQPKEADKVSDAKPTYTKNSSKIEQKGEGQIAGVKCVICLRKFAYRKNMLCHIQVHKLSYNGRNYACSICKEVFSYVSAKELEEHNDEKHAIQEPDLPQIQCLLCPRTFRNRAFMISTHLPKHNITSNGITFSCSICNEKFDTISPDQYKEHNKKHPQEETKVDIKKTVTRKFQLRKRKQINKSLVFIVKRGMTKCHLCPSAFISHYDLKTHLRNIHKVNAQENRSRGTRKDLSALLMQAPIKKILRQNVNTNNIQEQSSRKLKNRPKRSSARRILKKNNSRHRCNLCVKVFLYRSSLVRHKKTHGENEMPVLTPIYSEMTKQQSQPSNKQNKRRERQFECRICKVLVASKVILKRHMSIKHPGKSMNIDNSKWKFQCEQCSQIFTRAFHLQRHVYDYHETDPPRRTKREINADYLMHECSICSTILHTPSYRRHMRERHGKLIKDDEKEYCQKCDLYLENKEHLQNHNLKEHTT